MTITPEWGTGRVPLLDPATGRFSDRYAPPVVAEAVEGLEAIRTDMLARAANLGDVPDAAAARSHLGAAPAVHEHTIEQVTGLPGALAAKADLVGGVVPTSQIPRQALADTHVVASEAAMLALSPAQVQPGDLAVRTDGAGTFILADPDPSLLGSWVHLAAPTDAVTSVQGQQGTVVLSAADVGATTPAQVAAAVAAVEITAAGYATQASGSATAAAGSAADAATERVNAQTAQTGAVTARTGAETARAGAETARAQTEATITSGLSWAGAVDLSAVAVGPVYLSATLTANATLTLPSLTGLVRAYTVTLCVVPSVAGLTLTIPGLPSWGAAVALSGPGRPDLIHLLAGHVPGVGARWIVLGGAQSIGVA